MLMGEYDYTLTFVTEESSSWMARIIFVAFVVDMSVVLMNLVLGLAISDIEEVRLSNFKKLNIIFFGISAPEELRSA